MTQQSYKNGTDSLSLAPVRLSTVLMTPRESFDLWSDILAESYDVLPNGEVPSLRSVMEVWPIENAVYSRFDVESAFLHRSRKHIRNSLGGYVKIRRILSGRMRLDDGETVFDLTAGAIHVIDISRPYRETGTSCVQQNAFLPAHEVGFVPDHAEICHSFPESTSIGRIMATAFDTLFKDLANARAAEASFRFKQVMTALLSGSRRARAHVAYREARVLAMQRFLRQRLTEAGLGIDDLRRTFGASRATIYRDFAEMGGVDAFIRERRLDRAYLQLAESGGARGVIRKAAEELDFSSMAAFSRMFRNRFNEAPSDVVGRFAKADDTSTVAGPRDASWVRMEGGSAAETYRELYRQQQASPAMRNADS